MKVEELRIGNYLEIDGKIEMVSSIHSDNTIRLQESKNAKCHGCYSLNKPIIKPIPLSEEIVLKCGFEKYEFDHKENEYRYKYRLIVLRDGKFVDYGSSVTLEHIHQLQNLFYSLTGEELTLKTTL
jgi:hypothetical protein